MSGISGIRITGSKGLVGGTFKYKLHYRRERLGGFKCTCPRHVSMCVGMRDKASLPFFSLLWCSLMLMHVLGSKSVSVTSPLFFLFTLMNFNGVNIFLLYLLR